MLTVHDTPTGIKLRLDDAAFLRAVRDQGKENIRKRLYSPTRNDWPEEFAKLTAETFEHAVMSRHHDAMTAAAKFVAFTIELIGQIETNERNAPKAAP